MKSRIVCIASARVRAAAFAGNRRRAEWISAFASLISLAYAFPVAFAWLYNRLSASHGM